MTSADPFVEAKDRIRKQSTWIVATFGAIAAVLVAGSQLADIGSLNSDAEATVFGWTWRRTNFAVLGLGVALGSAALVIALASRVHSAGFVTLSEIHKWKAGRWTVKSKVKGLLDDERRLRLDITPGNPGFDSPTNFVIDTWRDAYKRERDQRQSLIEVTDALARLRSPRLRKDRTAPDISKAVVATKLGKVAAKSTSDISRETGRRVVFHPVATIEDHRLPVVEAIESECTNVYELRVKESSALFRLVELISDEASYLRLRFAFNRLVVWLTASGFACGAGIALFAWATHPPSIEPKRTTAVFVLQAAADGELLQLQGEGCDPSSVVVTPLPGSAAVAVTAASDSDESTCLLEAPGE